MTNGDIVRELARRIEGRWTEDLSVPALAAEAGYSLHHFSRLFAGVVGVPPREYVERRRLSEAARVLGNRKRRITDIALDFGFKDLETFSRAFVRVFGIAPSAVRRGAGFEYYGPFGSDGPKGPELLPLPATVREAGFLIAGWSVRGPFEDGSVGRLWSRFPDRAATIRSSRKPLSFRQLAVWREDEEDRIDILAGVVVETLDSLEIDLEGRAVPDCDCLVFEHRGSASGIAASYRTIYSRLLPAMSRKPTLPFNFESYPMASVDPYADSYRFFIHIPLA